MLNIKKKTKKPHQNQGQHHLWHDKMIGLDEEFGPGKRGRGRESASLGICAWLIFVQCLPSEHELPPSLTAPPVSSVAYSPCHKHSESLVHLPLLIAVEAGLKPFSPFQMCVDAPRVCFYPEPDRRKCLILQSLKEGAWRKEERREFLRLGGVCVCVCVKLVPGRQEGLGWVCWL